MFYSSPGRAAVGALLCCALISQEVSADPPASDTAVNEASITPDTFFGPRTNATPYVKNSTPTPTQAQTDTSLRGFLLHWNGVAIDASGLDHTPVGADEDRVYGEAVGPGRSSARWRSCTSRSSMP